MQASVLLAIAKGSADVAETLRTASTGELGTSNALGDKQLVADIEADNKVLAALQASGAVRVASSEEQPYDIPLNGKGYSVAYDPLDGSSIIGANWAVGSIFGVWPGAGFIGRWGSEQIAAAYTVHGPRTALVMARPRSPSSSFGLVDRGGADDVTRTTSDGGGGGGSTNNNNNIDTTEVNDDRDIIVQGGDLDAAPSDETTTSTELVVQEYWLINDKWVLQRDNIQIPTSKKIFAPANLRASAENDAYAELVRYWMEQRYTLRYSGGMVPDIHHIFAKGGGVFCNPTSPSSPAKLRLLYECFPLAFVVEAAGGSSYDGMDSILQRKLKSHDERSGICLGSELEVVKCLPAMLPLGE